MDRSAAQHSFDRVPVASLVSYAKNSRKHKAAQVDQIAAAIRQWGFTNPVLVDDTGVIIAGHGRVLAAQQVGLESVPVVRVVGLSADERRALVIADNQLALNSGWDRKLLGTELGELRIAGFDMGLLGFAPNVLQGLLPASVVAGLTDSDAAPPIEDAVVARVGDVWLLGGASSHCLRR